MNKCDILALIKACQNKIEEILDMNISEKNKKGFEELLHATEKHYNIVENAKEDDTKLFESYASLYSSLYYKLRTIDGKVYNENVSFNSIRCMNNRYDLTHNLENIVYNELIYMDYELKVLK